MENIKKMFGNEKVKKINAVICCIIVFLLDYKFVTSVVTGTEVNFETIRSRYLWNGLLFFGISICLLSHINWKKIWNWLAFIIPGVVCLYLLNKTGYRVNSPDLWKWYLARDLTFVVFFGIFVNACLEKKIVKLKEHNIVFYGLLASLLGLLAVKGLKSNVEIIILVFIFSLIRFEEKRLYEGIFIFGIAYYAAFLKTFIQSLITAPYQGGRYYGVFTNNGMFGSFTAGAFVVCATFWIYVYLNEIKKKKIIIGILTVALIPPVLATSIIGARVAIFGELAVVLAIFLIIGIEKNHKAFIALAIVIGIGIIGITAIILTHRYISKEWIESISGSSNFIFSKIAYWYDRIDKLFIKESRTGIIPAGTIWNIIDAFSSTRVTFFVEYFRELNLWGHGNLTLDAKDYIFLPHPHNTYIAFEYYYGIIMGSIIIGTMLAGSVLGGIKLHKTIKKKDNFLFLTFAVLWLLFGFALYLFEVYMFNFFVTIVMFFIVAEVSKNIQGKGGTSEHTEEVKESV